MARKAITTILSLVQAAEQIQLTKPIDDNALGFAAQMFVMATFPHSDPGNVSHWWRHNGNLKMTIQPGWNGDKCYGLPYGTIPRLLIYWLTSEAVRTGSRRIYRGDNLSEFLYKLGYDVTGGNIKRVKDQADRLFRSNISFDWSGDNGEHWLNMTIAKGGFKCWQTETDQPSGENNNYIILDPDYFLMITSSPTPIDLRALKELRNSALYLDLYTWLCYRMFTLKRRTRISWVQLYQQFGANYKNVDEWARKVKQGIKTIGILWPALKYDFPKGGLILEPSPPHIATL